MSEYNIIGYHFIIMAGKHVVKKSTVPYLSTAGAKRASAAWIETNMRTLQQFYTAREIKAFKHETQSCETTVRGAANISMN